MKDDSWIAAIVESTYQGALNGNPGCWISNVDRCSYSHLGNLVFKRGDDYYIRLTEEQFRKEMSPT